MTTMICTQCSEPRVVTSRSVSLPFVCDECEKAPELLAAMAPAYPLTKESCGGTCELHREDACDSATIENTTLLIEDQANQLALAKNEVDALRQINQYLEAREVALMAQNDHLRNNVEKYQSDLCLVNIGLQCLTREFAYAAKRLFELVTENGILQKERDVWQKRALIAKRCYDRASADRRYYRGKLKDAGIKT